MVALTIRETGMTPPILVPFSPNEQKSLIVQDGAEEAWLQDGCYEALGESVPDPPELRLPSVDRGM